MSPESVAFSSKYPTGENAYFEWKQKRTVFLHLYLNAKKPAATPPLFQNRAVFTACISDTLLKTICLVLIIMLIVLKSCVLNPYPFNLISTHIRSTCTESVCHTAREYSFMSYCAYMVKYTSYLALFGVV